MPIRDINLLDHRVAYLAKEFVAEVKRQLGLDIMIVETLRINTTQNAYYAQGRKSIDDVNTLRLLAGLAPITPKQNQRRITWTLESIHLYGCAFDIALKRAGVPIWDNKADINENDIPDYEEIARVGESLGLTAGIRFKKPDPVHFQYTGDLTLKDLQAGRRPSDKPT